MVLNFARNISYLFDKYESNKNIRKIQQKNRIKRSVFEKWCRLEDLNPQPTDYDSVALPVALSRRV